MARKASFEAYKGRGAQPWRWRLKAANGKIVATGEGFGSERDAWRSVDAVKRAIWNVKFNEAVAD